MSVDDPELATGEHGRLGADLRSKARVLMNTLLREEARLQSALELLQASQHALALIEERALRRRRPDPDARRPHWN